MSWTSGDLPVLAGREELFWSTRAASLILDCPMREIRDLVRDAGLVPAGKRHETGFGTRHVPVYAASDILRIWERSAAGGTAALF